MRKKNIVKGAVVVGAVLALAMPGTAYASTTATVYTPGSTHFANAAAGALLKTAAQCSSGLVSGGGAVISDDNNLRLAETEPSPDGTNPATGTTTDPTYWLGYAGVGGQGGTFDVQPYAVCFTNSTINHTQVVVGTVSGPSGTDVMASKTVTCPANTRLLGGGAKSELASNKSVKVIGSYPSDGSGNAVGNVDNPGSWTAVALNGGMSGTGNQTTVFAICSGNGINISGITVKVKHTHVSGPTSASSSTTATTAASCDTGYNLIGGGGSISGSDPTSGSFTAPGSQGDHLTALYPSNSTGTANGNNTSTTNWSARGRTGGSASPNTYTDVWGLCMN